MNLFVFLCVILLCTLTFLHYATRQTNAETWDIRLVNYRDNPEVRTENSNELSSNHAGDQTQFWKNLANPALGYSAINDIGDRMHVDLSSTSSGPQQSDVDGEHNHKEGDNKVNGNGNNNKNSDTPFTLPFP